MECFRERLAFSALHRGRASPGPFSDVFAAKTPAARTAWAGTWHAGKPREMPPLHPRFPALAPALPGSALPPLPAASAPANSPDGSSPSPGRGPWDALRKDCAENEHQPRLPARLLSASLLLTRLLAFVLLTPPEPGNPLSQEVLRASSDGGQQSTKSAG